MKVLVAGKDLSPYLVLSSLRAACLAGICSLRTSFKVLTEHFETYVLSTAPWDNPSAWSDKLLWIKNNLGEHAFKRLILTHHKNLNIGDYLIDDRKARGADLFGGEHIHFGAEKFLDWPSVLNYLFKKEAINVSADF